MGKKKKILPSSNSFGDRFRELRKNLGFSQREYAKKLGYKTSASISNIESGKCPVDSRVLLILSELGEVDYNWLLTGKRLPDKDLEKSYHKLLMRMAEYVARGLAENLQLRETRVLELAEQLTKRENGEEVDEDFIEQLESEIAMIQRQITEFGKDHPWLQEAIQRVNDRLLDKYSDNNDLKK
jgi:transcriptional regulator with XRE-family HTH domain